MARLRLCHICGATFPTLAERNAHRATAHPGTRSEWRGRELWIIEADGSERRLNATGLRKLRRGEPAEPAADEPEPDEPGAAPADDAGIPSNEPPREPEPDSPTVHQRPPRPRVMQQAEPRITRATLSDAFTVETLADLLRQLSQVVSEADGAGEAGWLSRTEAATLASLMYDSTLDLVIRRFAGDVGRFKVAVAILILLVGKGRVHAIAIGRKVREARAARAAELPAPAETPEAEPTALYEEPYAPGWPGGPAPAPVPAPAPDDPMAELAARQEAWRQAHGMGG